MTITFFSNFFNHHQKPVSDELFAILGSNYTFVATIPMPDSFSKAGYPDFSKTPYLLNSYTNDETHQEAMRLGLESDIVILGAAPTIFIAERLKLNKHTFRYSERIFKKSRFQKYNPRAIFTMYNLHTKYRNHNKYVLCASAYTANDLNWVYAYPNKMYKWGYFTKTEPINIEEIVAQKRNTIFTILFVARLIDWKHPEMAIKLAKRLKDKKYIFKLNIIGTGSMEDALKKMTKRLHLEDVIVFLSNVPNEQVISEMRKSNVFLFTSDRNEGWGAVANEAMANGCTLVASHEIGAVPYLIKPDINGTVFTSGNMHELTYKMEELIKNRQLCEVLAFNAYETVNNTWSPKAAATNLLKLCNEKLNNKSTLILKGPGSKANSTPANWHKKINL